MNDLRVEAMKGNVTVLVKPVPAQSVVMDIAGCPGIVSGISRRPAVHRTLSGFTDLFCHGTDRGLVALFSHDYFSLDAIEAPSVRFFVGLSFLCRERNRRTG